MRPALYLIITGIGLGAAQLTFALMDVLSFAVIVAGFIGGFKVVLRTMSTTVVQTLVDEEFRGRVMSINQFTWGASALGGLLMGYLAQEFNAPTAMTIGGSVAIAATALVGQRLLRSFGIGTSIATPSQKLGTTTESAT